MITNASTIIDSMYKCNKPIMTYLVKSGVPILSYDDKHFYFANTELLKKSLKTMPLYLKILNGISGERR